MELWRALGNSSPQIDGDLNSCCLQSSVSDPVTRTQLLLVLEIFYLASAALGAFPSASRDMAMEHVNAFLTRFVLQEQDKGSPESNPDAAGLTEEQAERAAALENYVPGSPEEKRIVRKIDWVLLPCVCNISSSTRPSLAERISSNDAIGLVDVCSGVPR